VTGARRCGRAADDPVVDDPRATLGSRRDVFGKWDFDKKPDIFDEYGLTDEYLDTIF